MAIGMALVLAATAAAPHPSLNVAQGSELIRQVQACQQVKDDAARLACYDRNVSALTTANARGDVTVVDRSQMRAARRSLFGFDVGHLPFFGSKDKDVQEEPKQLVSTLRSFRDIGNGFFRFTIADPESTWESTESSNVFDPRIGEKVTINHGAMGSYFVTIGSNQAVRAHRIH